MFMSEQEAQYMYLRLVCFLGKLVTRSYYFSIWKIGCYTNQKRVFFISYLHMSANIDD